MEALLRSELNVPSRGSNWRELIGERAEKLLVHVGEQDLRTFCIRLKDTHLANPQWIESIAGYLLSKPPSKWNDDNQVEFARKLTDIVGRFVRVENAAFGDGCRPERRQAFVWL
jgi:hypothetical protein